MRRVVSGYAQPCPPCCSLGYTGAHPIPHSFSSLSINEARKNCRTSGQEKEEKTRRGVSPTVIPKLEPYASTPPHCRTQ